MTAFSFTRQPIDPEALRVRLADPAAGGYASFEGWVRNHNEGLAVEHLEYEAFEALAVKEGERIVADAIERFGIEHAACVHRVGDLAIGEMAVWVGVSARHRAEAFSACRYIIDEVKHRVPIWKKEHYVNGDSGWVNCERCAATHESSHGHSHEAARIAIPGLASDYSRQVALKEVGVAGQAKLSASRVLIVGCGGLGVPVISYLAGAGVGRLSLVDADVLEPSNLHRQTLYALADTGKPKVELAAARVRALNPEVDVRAHQLRLDELNAAAILSGHDLVIDCTDNFATKFLLNDLCLQHETPVIFASVYQYEGQLQVVKPGSACLRCIWPEATRDGIVGNCSEAGVLGPVPGVFGGLQAFEAMRMLLGLPGQLANEVLVLDLLTLSTSRVRTRRSPGCPQHAIAPADRAASRDAPQVELTFNTLEQAIASGLEIIDIREAHEVTQAPLPGVPARHVPLGELLHGDPPFRPVGRTLLVCASGRRSLAATLTLRERGFAHVFSLCRGARGLSEPVPT